MIESVREASDIDCLEMCLHSVSSLLAEFEKQIQHTVRCQTRQILITQDCQP